MKIQNLFSKFLMQIVLQGADCFLLLKKYFFDVF